jgi:hypothetical protein
VKRNLRSSINKKAKPSPYARWPIGFSKFKNLNIGVAKIFHPDPIVKIILQRREKQ